mgnify:CR=1 FL=1
MVLRLNSFKSGGSISSKLKVIIVLIILTIVVILHSIKNYTTGINDVLILSFFIALSFSVIITLIALDKALGL